MLSLDINVGKPIAKIEGGSYDKEIITLIDPYTIDQKSCCKKCSKKCEKKRCCGGCKMCFNKKPTSNMGKHAKTIEGKITQLPNFFERSVHYICGPSGSGKTTEAVNIAQAFKKVFPKKDIYLFSRSDAEDDPALVKLKPIQIKINESLIENPIDITKELNGGTLIIFDDCNTIQDLKLKKIVENLMKDIIEIGRKLKIWIIITNHLVIPDEKKIARCIMNEFQTITVFPQSGSRQQIEYAFKTYIGLKKSTINEILSLPTRALTVSRTYPQYVIYDSGVMLL